MRIFQYIMLAKIDSILGPRVCTFESAIPQIRQILSISRTQVFPDFV